MDAIDLSRHGIKVLQVYRNPSPASLCEQAIRHRSDTAISATGALVAYSGAKAGRSPTDKRVVRAGGAANDVWWGSVNVPLDRASFEANRQRAIEYLNGRERIYCIDAFAGWDPRFRLKIRVLCARAYHALFMQNMLIRPSASELADFGEPDYVIYNAGQFPADATLPGMTSETTIGLDIEAREIVILGTEYAGEMKKGVFTLMNYLMPKSGHLSMHCSATESRQDGTTSILFGLSGTGKTTLSADPKRLLIGDDEHVWTDRGIFNIEGGCYAKVVRLRRESEPDIYDAIRFGTVLENVVFDPDTRVVDFDDTSITENTRASYPLEFLTNAKLPATGAHPHDVIFLTCDAFGVLPPVSRLTPEQAMYHFISGYTAKVAGTEVGVTEPEVTFSPCFGGPFLVWHPAKYAELLARKIAQHSARVWLVNTGWTGGGFDVGSRISIHQTRAIIDAIHERKLDHTETRVDPVFGFEVPKRIAGVPERLLDPRANWPDAAGYDLAVRKLAQRFIVNFSRYAESAGTHVTAAGPVLAAT